MARLKASKYRERYMAHLVGSRKQSIRWPVCRRCVISGKRSDNCSLNRQMNYGIKRHIRRSATAGISIWRRFGCHFGGQRPWFVCSVGSNGRYCGRRAAILYCAGDLFACRRCYGLSYASQQQSALHRGLEQARKIRMRLGGSADLLEPFPPKPKGMHRRTFRRLRARAEAALFASKPSAH
jgi:hypothetical protein